MSGTPDPIAWLRPLVEADRKRWAEQVAHLQGAPHRLAVTFSSEIAGKIAYAEEQIFRCEAELAILDEHPPNDSFGADDICCSTCGDVPQVPFPCSTVRLLASGYRHRPGYREEWKS